MLGQDLIKSGSIKFGDFVLTSGKKSDYYVDIKEGATKPELLNEISVELSKKLTAKKIAGMELGAVPLIVATSLKANIPYIIVRKEEREHGTKKRIIGEINKNEEIDLIEDVVTTGNSLLKTADILRKNGAVIRHAICVVDRESGGYGLLKSNGIELESLVKISDILKSR